jgi:hypothetical protein
MITSKSIKFLEQISNFLSCDEVQCVGPSAPLMKLEDRRRVTASRAAVRSRFGVTAISQDFQYNTASPHRRTPQTLLHKTTLPSRLEDICDRIPRTSVTTPTP